MRCVVEEYIWYIHVVGKRVTLVDILLETYDQNLPT